MVLSLTPDSKGEVHEVEVTTFRSEEEYVDGRWPSSVEFVVEIDKDLEEGILLLMPCLLISLLQI
jgi:hypothetical protein